MIQRLHKKSGITATKNEIALIKNRLQELEFNTQAAANAYKKTHKVKPGTKITVKSKKSKNNKQKKIRIKHQITNKKDNESNSK